MDGDSYEDAPRRKLRCALVRRGVPPIPQDDWHENLNPRRAHMGRLPILDHERFHEVQNPRAPEESHEHGCPGAWYRCKFSQSIRPYERLFNPQGGFSSNVLLERTDDPLVIEATQFLENEVLRRYATDSELRWSDR